MNPWIWLFGCLPHTPTLEPLFSDSVTLPIYRSQDKGERLFVAVTLPTVGKQYFMIDTGSSVSALRKDLVDAMELYVERKNGYLSGVSGRVPWIETTVPSVTFGDQTLEQIPFAVAVEGLPTQSGLVPIAGIIGNNIWDQFTVEIDYGLQQLQLHSTFTFDKQAQTVSYDGQHILAPIELEFGENSIQTLIANIDTGSSGLILNASHVPQLLEHAEDSKETIMGVGADKNNVQDYVLNTQSVKIQTVTLGGSTQPYDDPAILLSPSEDGFTSLVGHHVLENHRLVIGYQQEKVSLRPSREMRPANTLHEDYLRSLQKGDMQADPMMEIQLLFALDRDSTAVRKLKRMLAKDNNPAYRLALANHYYQAGALADTIVELEQIDETIRDEMGITQALIMSYLYTGKLDQAEAMLSKKLSTNPNDVETLWVQSQWSLLKEDIQGAKVALYKAQNNANPNDFLVHKALLKHLSEDLTGAVSALRTDVQQHPLGNHSLWFLARLAVGTPYEQIARDTIEPFLTLRNSRRGSLDFLAASLWELNEKELALEIATEGKERDCVMTDDDERANCKAWYDALTHQTLPCHITTMQQIVEKNPGRSDYADTLAVLYRSSGQVDKAIEASKQAMIFAGSDPYMIWQALSKDSLDGNSPPENQEDVLQECEQP